MDFKTFSKGFIRISSWTLDKFNDEDHFFSISTKPLKLYDGERDSYVKFRRKTENGDG